ncbi:DUF2795 domain-containing protein [Streptomyces sp. ACA25]|uniref:DUF2795 domain-containing protein n=1 Tax=Streptomyces sp. ACA25 TaxID=3022596 RepID=UPI002307F662|nr:DUF2795 domain-containing protein [Streptomyces sp. ACA25]MDB1089985.1 DUF2795 domain-containing protein [Streptomyces sp. ACA25]
MPDRSNHLSVHRDDEVKREMQGALRGDRPTRSDEWRSPEPVSDDDRQPAWSPDPGLHTEEQDETFRSELARHLRPSIYPAGREDLLRTLQDENAPDGLLDTVAELPREGSYVNVQEVVTALGRKPRA